MTDDTCQICRARPAEMVVLRRRGDEMIRTLACRECAGERARLYGNADLDLGEILARLDAEGSRGRPKNGACELCGATLADILTEGKPGCCLCYTWFHSTMEDLIREAQRHTRHNGKAPRQ